MPVVSMTMPITAVGDGVVLNVNEDTGLCQIDDREAGVHRYFKLDDPDFGKAVQELQEAHPPRGNPLDVHKVSLEQYGAELEVSFWRSQSGIGCDIDDPEGGHVNVFLNQIVTQSRSAGLADDHPYNAKLDEMDSQALDLGLESREDLNVLLNRVGNWFAWVQAYEPKSVPAA